jgi:succinoglycan biosynthesis transport protein ExoP
MSELEPLTRSLDRYLGVLRRQWWLTVIVTVVALAASIAYVAQATPVYSASSKVVVGQGRTLFNPSLSVDFEAFTSTISSLLQSNVVAQDTINDLGLKMSPTSLLANLSVSSQPDGAVIDVAYDDTDQARAVDILKTVDSVFTTLLNNELAARTTSTTATSASTSTVTAAVFDPAHLDPGKVSPHTTRSIVIALVLGVVLGIVLAFIRDALSSAIKSESDAESAFGIPTVGSLPRGVLGISIARLSALPRHRGLLAAEAIRMMGSRLRYSTSLERGVIVVVGARPEDGKSTVAAHLAAELTRSGNDVIAVEADLHRPSLHRLLGISPGQPGIYELGEDGGPLTSLLVPVEDLAAEQAAALRPLQVALAEREGSEGSGLGPDENGLGFGELRLLPAGQSRGIAASTVLSAGTVSSLLLRLRAMSDYVVVDTPPLLLAGDAFPFIQMADLVVVVARRGQTRQNDAARTREQLRSLDVHAQVLVVSESDIQAEVGYYGYAN